MNKEFDDIIWRGLLNPLSKGMFSSESTNSINSLPNINLKDLEERLELLEEKTKEADQSFCFCYKGQWAMGQLKEIAGTKNKILRGKIGNEFIVITIFKI